MTQARLNHLLGQLQRASVRPPSDGELLSRFIERREEEAFAALLRRHGPLVLGVCRRVLGNAHDAEDAFQATFLVLVRKATSIRPREAVAGWLYGVAYRTALDARTRLMRQRRREKQLAQMPAVEARPDDPWEELRPLLDREVHRLPDIYRLAIVLCDLEGRSRKAAAEQLGVPEGTLSSRLAAARKKLAQRLSRHGLAFTAGTLTLLLDKSATSAAVPAALEAATTGAALLVAAGQTAAVSGTVAALTEGVLKTMFLAKIKTATVVLLGVTVLGLGTGTLYQAAASGPQKAPQAAEDRGKPDRDAGKPVIAEVPARILLWEAKQKEPAISERERALLEQIEALKKELTKARERAWTGLQFEVVPDASRLRILQAQKAEAEARQKAETPKPGMPIYIEFHPHRPGSPNAALEDLKKTEDKVQAQTHQRCMELEMQLQKINSQRAMIEAEMQQVKTQGEQALQTLRQKAAEISKQAGSSQPGDANPKADITPSLADKLDRVLDKLEQMERRLDRLERAGGHGK